MLKKRGAGLTESSERMKGKRAFIWCGLSYSNEHAIAGWGAKKAVFTLSGRTICRMLKAGVFEGGGWLQVPLDFA